MATAEITEPIVLDSTANAIKDAILKVASAINKSSGVIYGFHIDGTESDPSTKVTYLEDAIGMTPAHMNYSTDSFSYGSWGDAFFMPKPCMLKQNGLVDYYLNPDDYTKKEDGTASDIANTAYAGNAMMEWGQNGKKIWLKIVPDSNGKGGSVYISDHEADSLYHDWSFHNYKGASIDHFYTHIYNGSNIDSVLRSLSGQQVSKSKTAQGEIDLAKANNPSGSEMWNIGIFADILLINCLLILISKSTDSQTAFGQGLNSSGSEAINDAFRTGVHNTKGLFYGTNSGAAATYTNAVKVFGMENWWGFQLQRYLGHIMVNGVQKVKLTNSTEDGTTATGFNLTGDGYRTVTSTAPSGTNGGYISEMLFTQDGLFPLVSSGSSSTHYCDGLWFNNAITSVPLCGGYSYGGAPCGALCVALNCAAGVVNWYFGASLSCKP